MSSYAPLARPVLAGTLSLLLATLWLWPPPAAPTRHLPALLPPASPDTTDTAISQWAGTALARPLFTPGRRPADQAGAATDGSLPRLSAIIITGATRAAVFAADGQKPQVIDQGGTIDGYALNRIAPDHVELTGPDGTLSLRPQFTAAAATSSSSTSSPPPPDSPAPGQTQPALNPSSNPALMIEQNY